MKEQSQEIQYNFEQGERTVSIIYQTIAIKSVYDKWAEVD